MPCMCTSNLVEVPSEMMQVDFFGQGGNVCFLLFLFREMKPMYAFWISGGGAR